MSQRPRRGLLYAALVVAALAGVLVLGERRRTATALEPNVAERAAEASRPTAMLEAGPPEARAVVDAREPPPPASTQPDRDDAEYRRKRQERIANHRAVRKPKHARTGWVEGRLSIEDSGTPDLSAWKIYVRVLGARRAVSRPLRVDGAGFFRAEELPQGTVRVEAFHPSIRFGCSAEVRVWEASGSWVELAYSGPDPARCLGIDVDARRTVRFEGAHLVDADDRVFHPTVEKAQRYLFTGLPEGDYRFYAFDAEGVLQEGRGHEGEPLHPGQSHWVRFPAAHDPPGREEGYEEAERVF